MPTAKLICPSCKNESSSRLLCAHLAAYHKSDIKKMFLSESGVQSQQAKHYSTLNLGDGSQYFCCFGCKTGWLSMNVANKHKDGECLTKHRDFLVSLDTRTVEEKLFEALQKISELETDLKKSKEECNKAKGDLQLYDQVKQHAYDGHFLKLQAAERYIQEFQKVIKPIIYQDLSGCQELRNFTRADENAKINFTAKGDHVPLSDILQMMNDLHKRSKFLTASLFPSYMTFLKQEQFKGTTNSFVAGDTWLEDYFRHYYIRMPELQDIDAASYKEASNILITPAVDASLPEL